MLIFLNPPPDDEMAGFRRHCVIALVACLFIQVYYRGNRKPFTKKTKTIIDDLIIEQLTPPSLPRLLPADSGSALTGF